MKKTTVLVGFMIASLTLSAATGDENIVSRFDGGIGVQPVLVNAATSLRRPASSAELDQDCCRERSTA